MTTKIPDFGICTALVTPMKQGGAIDLNALEKLVLIQKEAGAKALLALGTTGEACFLTDSERGEVLRTIKRVFPQVFLFAGCGSNDAKKAFGYAALSKNCGADALLAVTPYYSKGTEAGVAAYYRKLAETGLPVFCYNVPGRTGYSMPVSLVQTLFNEGAIAGIKEASGDVIRVAELALAGVAVYSGDDLTALPSYAVGARGCFSVTANVAFSRAAEIFRLFSAGEVTAARHADEALRPLSRALFSEVNPVPVKAALSLLGITEEGMRPPLTPLSPDKKRELVKALVRLRMI